MAILTDHALDFAREHIERYYDSDFFPKPPEFAALWHFWDEVKAELKSKNVPKMWVTPPRAMTISKPRGGYRVVHQLEPLDAVVYTAMAFEIAEKIESAREPAADQIACSYRFDATDGSFFAGGTGWDDFDEKTQALLDLHAFVLVTDISDFYNQIYLHRLNNAIESADSALKHWASDIENFLMTLNNKASQGVPVGPAASIVMSEAVLIDVDQFLKSKGVAHTRYVDDIRLFGNSRKQLQRVLEELTLYLYEAHRLTVSSEKTALYESAVFMEKHFKSPYADEKANLMDSLEEFNPYADDYDAEDDSDDDQEELVEKLQEIINYSHLDLGLARSVIRTARRNGIDVIAEHLLINFEFFSPVINDVVLYLDEVTDDELAKILLPRLEEVIESPGLNSDLARFWLEFYISKYPRYLASPKLAGFVYAGSIENQAQAAITTKNVAWVRNQKNSIYDLGGRARRAVLNASRVLPSDERGPWLKLFSVNTPLLTEKWLARWVAETA